MKNNYLNFEQAKKIRDKGFDIPTFAAYGENDKFDKKKNSLTFNYKIAYKNSELGVLCSAPEQHTAIDWLFENYEIWIECFVDDNKTFGYLITRFSDEGRQDYPLKRNFSNQQEAYSNAFDFIFDNNLI
jgi:hypothetical protein